MLVMFTVIMKYLPDNGLQKREIVHNKCVKYFKSIRQKYHSLSVG